MVPVEQHIVQFGPHGAGMGQNLPGLSELAIWPVPPEQWTQSNNSMPSPKLSEKATTAL